MKFDLDYLENKDYRIISEQEYEAREDSGLQKYLVKISAFDKPNQEEYSCTLFFEILNISEAIDNQSILKHFRDLFFHNSKSFRQEIYQKSKF